MERILFNIRLICQYTILSYVDSAGCFSCKLQLPMWREFYTSVRITTYPGKVSVLLFLHSKSEIELLYALKRMALTIQFV